MGRLVSAKQAGCDGRSRGRPEKIRRLRHFEHRGKGREATRGLGEEGTANAFLSEMKRFLPARRVAQLTEAGLRDLMLADNGDLLRRAILPVSTPAKP